MYADNMLVHDMRLFGKSPLLAPNRYEVDEHVPIRHCFDWVATYARKTGGLQVLFILAHGYFHAEDPIHRLSSEQLGFGLELCQEGLTLLNVDITAVLSGLVRHIILYACGPANTRPGFEGTLGDGRRFCGYLAAYTGATVIASDTAQTYTYGGLWPFDRIDFGAWEGGVYQFSPDGAVVRIQ